VFRSDLTVFQRADFVVEPLGRRVRAGVAWSAAALLVTYLTGLGRAVVLARLLAPEDFGLFGMALTVTAAVGALTHMGLDVSLLVHNFSDDEEFAAHLNTIWTAEVVRKCLLTLLLLALVYPTARFYGEGRLYLVLSFISLTPLVQGFHNIGLLILRKKVSFRKIIWFEQTTNILTTALAIGLAYWLRSVWALVYSQLLSTLLGVLLSYAFHPYRPRFAFDRAAAARAFDFGKFVLVISVAAYVTTMADNILVGRWFGAAALGIYVVAYNLASLPIGIINGVLGGVTLPAYAELRAQGAERLETAFVRLLSLSAAVLVILAVPFLLLADEVILLLYGAKWAAAAPLLRVLAVVAFCRGLLQVVAPLLVSLRGPRPEATAKVFEAILFLSLLYLLTSTYGLLGAAEAGACIYLITIIIRFRLLHSFMPRAARNVPRIMWATLCAGALGVGAGALILTFIDNTLMRFVAGASISTSVTALVLLRLLPVLRGELRQALTPLYNL
jgi:lipopolysaccharide exporter